MVALVAYDGTAQKGLPQALNVLALLEQRSPGARSGAALTKVKRQRTAASDRAGPEAHERALGAPFSPEAVNDVTEGLGLASPSELLAFAGPGAVKDYVPPAQSGGGGAPSSTTPFIGGGGGHGRGSPPDGGVGTGTEPTGDQPTTQVTAAVPEPGTWATMLLGMGLCGFGMRRRHRRSLRNVGQPCGAA